VKQPESLFATLAVRVVPRAATEGVAGYDGGVLRIRLCAPPLEGRANEALVRFLAKSLGVPNKHVTLASGEKGRNKIVRIEGMTLDAVLSLLVASDNGDSRACRAGSR